MARKFNIKTFVEDGKLLVLEFSKPIVKIGLPRSQAKLFIKDLQNKIKDMIPDDTEDIDYTSDD